MLIATSVAVAVSSISGTGDTPCGAILAPNFGWSTESTCGITHLGTLPVVGGLLLTGCALLVVASFAFTGRSSLRPALWLLAVMTVAATVASGLLAWRTSTWPEPVLRKGWVSVRNLTGYVAFGLLVLTVIARALTLDDDKNVDSSTSRREKASNTELRL